MFRNTVTLRAGLTLYSVRPINNPESHFNEDGYDFGDIAEGEIDTRLTSEMQFGISQHYSFIGDAINYPSYYAVLKFKTTKQIKLLVGGVNCYESLDLTDEPKKMPGTDGCIEFDDPNSLERQIRLHNPELVLSEFEIYTPHEEDLDYDYFPFAYQVKELQTLMEFEVPNE